MASTYGSRRESASVVFLSHGTKYARFDSRAVAISCDRSTLEMEFTNPTDAQCTFLRETFTGRGKVKIEVDNVFSFEGHCTSFVYGAGALDSGGTSAQVTFVDQSTRAFQQGVSGENESSSPRCWICGGVTVNTTRLGMETEFVCLSCSVAVEMPKKKRKRKQKKKAEPDVTTAPPERMIVLE